MIAPPAPAFPPSPHPHFSPQTPVPGMANHLAGMRMQSPPSPFAPPYGAAPRAKPSSRSLIWWVLALLAVGVGVGTAVALLMSK